VAKVENRLRRELVEDLLEGIEPDQARARALAQGHDLHVPHDVILVAWPWQVASANTGHDAETEQVRRAVERQRLPFLIARKPDMVVVIAHQGVEINQVYHDLSNGPQRSHGQVAIGEPAITPQEIPHAYAQARRALSALQQSSAPHGAAAHANLGVSRILAVEENASEVDDLIEDWLSTLITYDVEHGTDLLLTLAVYLDQGGSYAATARALFVHRNTLGYRLRRITEISGHDMSDVDTRLNLHVATRAWRLRRAEPIRTLARRSPRAPSAGPSHTDI
jgi:sugar diacid utilization regulator